MDGYTYRICRTDATSGIVADRQVGCIGVCCCCCRDNQGDRTGWQHGINDIHETGRIGCGTIVNTIPVGTIGCSTIAQACASNTTTYCRIGPWYNCWNGVYGY